MKTKQIQFENQHGHTLSGIIEFPPQGHIKAYAIFAHCFTCGKGMDSARTIARHLTSHNIAVLRFDFTGIGESEGKFSDTNFTSNVSDISDAAAYLKDHYEAPALIVGHSWGGTAALFAAGNISSIQAICTLAAPVDPGHITHLFEHKIAEIEESGHAMVPIGNNFIRINKHFLEDIRSHADLRFIQKLNKPLLIFHSPQDQVVSIDNATKIYLKARHPKSFISLDKADHLILKEEDAHFAGDMIGIWASHYLDFASNSNLRKSTPYQTVSRISDERYTTQIWAGVHHWIADEPKSIGGDNLGPTPYDMLSAALGTCTVMTLRMYANRKKWPLEEVEAHVEYSREHKDDLEDTTKTGGKIDVFKRYIEIKGDLDKKQISRLLEIADRCPVHKTLASASKIETKLIE